MKTYEELCAEARKNAVEGLFRLTYDTSNSSRELLVKAFVDHIKSEHNTNIQSFFRVIRQVIIEYSKTKYTDLRNEASVKWAQKIAAFDDNGFPYV